MYVRMSTKKVNFNPKTCCHGKDKNHDYNFADIVMCLPIDGKHKNKDLELINHLPEVETDGVLVMTQLSSKCDNLTLQEETILLDLEEKIAMKVGCTCQSSGKKYKGNKNPKTKTVTSKNLKILPVSDSDYFCSCDKKMNCNENQKHEFDYAAPLQEDNEREVSSVELSSKDDDDESPKIRTSLDDLSIKENDVNYFENSICKPQIINKKNDITENEKLEMYNAKTWANKDDKNMKNSNESSISSTNSQDVSLQCKLDLEPVCMCCGCMANFVIGNIVPCDDDIHCVCEKRNTENPSRIEEIIDSDDNIKSSSSSTEIKSTIIAQDEIIQTRNIDTSDTASGTHQEARNFASQTGQFREHSEKEVIKEAVQTLNFVNLTQTTIPTIVLETKDFNNSCRSELTRTECEDCSQQEMVNEIVLNSSVIDKVKDNFSKNLNMKRNLQDEALRNLSSLIALSDLGAMIVGQTAVTNYNARTITSGIPLPSPNVSDPLPSPNVPDNSTNEMWTQTEEWSECEKKSTSIMCNGSDTSTIATNEVVSQAANAIFEQLKHIISESKERCVVLNNVAIQTGNMTDQKATINEAVKVQRTNSMLAEKKYDSYDKFKTKVSSRRSSDSTAMSVTSSNKPLNCFDSSLSLKNRSKEGGFGNASKLQSNARPRRNSYVESTKKPMYSITPAKIRTPDLSACDKKRTSFNDQLAASGEKKRYRTKEYPRRTSFCRSNVFEAAKTCKSTASKNTRAVPSKYSTSCNYSDNIYSEADFVRAIYDCPITTKKAHSCSRIKEYVHPINQYKPPKLPSPDSSRVSLNNEKILHNAPEVFMMHTQQFYKDGGMSGDSPTIEHKLSEPNSIWWNRLCKLYHNNCYMASEKEKPPMVEKGTSTRGLPQPELHCECCKFKSINHTKQPRREVAHSNLYYPSPAVSTPNKQTTVLYNNNNSKYTQMKDSCSQ